MSTAYCIDVSGSISNSQLERAFNFVIKGMEPNDYIIAFDTHAVIVNPARIKNIMAFVPIGMGGTDPTEALLIAKSLGCYGTVLISDGYMPEDQIKQFNKFIDIESIK